MAKMVVGLLLASAILAVGPTSGAQATLVRDIRTQGDPWPGPEPRWPLALGGRLYFFGGSEVESSQPFSSDGTAAGTRLLKATGSCDGQWVGSVGSRALFACEGQLWASDGTTAGTVRLAEQGWYGGASVGPSVERAGVRYLVTADGALMRTDGTVSGTFALKTGPASALAATSNTAFFTLDDGVSGWELWSTDGTPAGTRLVKDVCPGACWGVAPGELAVLGNDVVFVGDDGSTGGELWRSDGSAAGTTLITELAPGSGGTGPRQLTTVGPTVFFADFGQQSGLGKTDGTAAGTVLVKGLMLDQLVAAGPRLFFTSWIGPPNSGELWTSDGTEAGTRLVADLCPGACLGVFHGSPYVVPLPTSGFLVSHVAEPGVLGLWQVNAGATSATLLREFSGGLGWSLFTRAAALGPHVYFGADDGANGPELWRSDGTAAGTMPVTDWRDTSSDPSAFAAVGETLFFAAHEPATGGNLWKSDGTEAGTLPVKDIEPGPGGTSVRNITPLGTGVVFSASSQPWRSDGTEGGTFRLRDVLLDNPPSGYPLPIAPWPCAGGHAFFVADDGAHGRELWKTDGTVPGTMLVKDLFPGTEGSSPKLMAAAGGLVYFYARSSLAASGYGLWRSDGTSAGTLLLKQGFVEKTVAVADRLYFALTEESGLTLWSTDGTSGGTVFVALLPAAVGQTDSIGEMCAAGRRLFFALRESANFFGRDLWVSEGTPETTHRVLDIYPGPNLAPNVAQLSAVGERVFFVATDPVHGRELWVSDGSEAGTQMVSELAAGNNQTDVIWHLAPAGGEVLFSLYGLDTGAEIWRSDGTEAGTALVTDIAPGPWSSHPWLFIPSGEKAYFSATDEAHGRELWSVPLQPALAVAAATVQEGHAGTHQVAIPVRLFPAAATQVQVEYATLDRTAVAGSDYQPAAGTLTFAAGETEQQALVTVLGDPFAEGNESFALELSSPLAASISREVAEITIANDDQPGGDADGNLTSDLWWRHALSGTLMLWRMNGTQRIDEKTLTPARRPDGSWQVAGTGDLDGDGKPDLLWRQGASGRLVLWTMNGAVRTNGYVLNPAELTDTAWRIVATGDFDRDGKADLVWQHETSRRVVAWLMNGFTRKEGRFFSPPQPADTSWRAVAAPDLDGDGDADLLWRHDASGRFVAWIMDGTTRELGAFLNPASPDDPAWTLVGAGDWNGDRRTDLLWRLPSTGELRVWLMDGVTRLAEVAPTPDQLADLDWRVVGPR